jgi:hypothetical protein
MYIRKKKKGKNVVKVKVRVNEDYDERKLDW